MYKSIEPLVLGDHAALFYRNLDEQLAAVVPYLQAGLERNERCLYVTGKNSVPMIREIFKTSGIDVEAETARGALMIRTGREAFLKDGAFEPIHILENLALATNQALAEGFSGLRGTGEMTWTLEVPGALERLVEYEALLDRRFPKKFLGLCQYEESSFRGAMMAEMIYLHSKVVTKEGLVRNPWYRPERYASFWD